MQVTKGTWRMRKHCSLSSSPAQEPGNQLSSVTTFICYDYTHNCVDNVQISGVHTLRAFALHIK